MGKRQYRISKKDLVTKANELQGRKVQIILADNHVFTGLLQSLAASEWLLKDARLNLHRISPNDVREVIYDRETLY